MKRDQENKSTPVTGKGSLKFQGYMGRKSSDGDKSVQNSSMDHKIA